MNRAFTYLLFTFGWIFFTAQSLSAQSSEEAKLYYTSEYSGGVIVHTHGFGANFRYGQNVHADRKRIWTIEAVNINHPKQQRSYNPFHEEARSFFYGKLNSLYLLRTQIGLQNTIFTKELRKGVEVNYILSAGPVLGFLKPVYLEIAKDSHSGRAVPATERYDPDEHSLNNIFGRAPALTGISETSIYPGLSVKLAMNFEYAPEDEILRSMEAGLNVDAFLSNPEIMAYAENPQVWITLYANILIGKKIL